MVFVCVSLLTSGVDLLIYLLIIFMSFHRNVSASPYLLFKWPILENVVFLILLLSHVSS
jgi:hypothetical protein